jgi:hypothetical protein
MNKPDSAGGYFGKSSRDLSEDEGAQLVARLLMPRV